jgi:predicted AAA+ superfamily ATPase
MLVIPRTTKDQIFRYLKPNKVVVLLGSRRVGKTFLLQQVLAESKERYVLLNGKDLATRELFARRSLPALTQIVDKKRLLVIDEAQKISDIGNALKLMVDEINGLKVLITGISLRVSPL